MKRTLLIAVAALMLTPAIFAQTTPYKFDEKQLLQKIQESDKEITNNRLSQRGQTWLDRGDVMYNAGTAAVQGLAVNMTLEKLIAARGKDFTTSTREVDGQTFTVVSYPSVDVYLLNDVVKFWNEKITVYENALDKAYEAFIKAAELDPKLEIKSLQGINSIVNYYKQLANKQHLLKQNLEAAGNFAKAYQLMIDPPVNVIDSAAMFNAGYLYLMQEDYQKAIEHFSRARSVGNWQDGDVGYYLMIAYKETAQNEKAKEVINEVAELFPDNKKVIDGLINYYIVTRQDLGEIKDFIITALENDPENITLLNGLGQIYLKQNDLDKVIEINTRILNIDPENVAANFYIADALIDKATNMSENFQNAQKGMSEAARKEALAAIHDTFKKALTPLDRAYQINPNEFAIVERLVIIYYRLGAIDPEMDAKYEKFNKIKEEMRVARGL